MNAERPPAGAGHDDTEALELARQTRTGTLLFESRAIEAADATDELLDELVVQMEKHFRATEWVHPNPNLHALVVVLPKLSAESWHLLDRLQRRAKWRLARIILVSRSPVPILAMRNMAFRDILFLDSDANPPGLLAEVRQGPPAMEPPHRGAPGRRSVPIANHRVRESMASFTQDMSGTEGHVTKLLSNRNFRLLWVGSACSLLGLEAADIAYPLVALAITGSPAWAGLFGAVQLAAALTVGLPAGDLLDRRDCRRVLIAAEGVRLLTTTGAAVALASGELGMPLLLIVAAALGAAQPFSSGARMIALRAVVPSEQLTAALTQDEVRVLSESIR